MPRPNLKMPSAASSGKLPNLPPFPEFEVSKESILSLSAALERRNSAPVQSRREPFEDILLRFTEGMMSSAKKNMP